MSYIVKQKIGKHIYAYEAESYYDKKKKQPRQRRKYLGRVDPLTGKIIETKKMKAKQMSLPRSAKSVGALHLLNSIAERIGLKDTLRRVFPDEWKIVLSLSFFELSEGKPLYLFKEWIEDTYTDDALKEKGNLNKGLEVAKDKVVEEAGLNEEEIEEEGNSSIGGNIRINVNNSRADGNETNNKIPNSSQSTSKLLKYIGEQDTKIEQFFINWISQRNDTKSMIFDITSISSYSNSIDIVEWGYNRDKENLPQINIGMIFGEPSSLPLFYTLYPGSIPDIVTLKNIANRLKSFHIRDISFVMDRGFFSKHNIELMYKNNIDFIMPVPFTTKISKELLTKHTDALSSPDNFFLLNNRVIFSDIDYIKLNNHKLTAFIYLDEKRKSEEVQRLLRRIGEVEREIEFHSFNSKEEVKEFIEAYRRGTSKYFSIKVVNTEGGETDTDKANNEKEISKYRKRQNSKQNEIQKKYILIRKKDEIEKAMNRMGKMILITNRTDLDKEKALSLYKRRNEIERLFDVLKNEIDGNRIRNHSDEAMEGKLFILFVTLVLYASLDKIMKEKGLYKIHTLQEIIYELKKIKVVETNNNNRFLTEISKKQKLIYEQFNVPLPTLNEDGVT